MIRPKGLKQNMKGKKNNTKIRTKKKPSGPREKADDEPKINARGTLNPLDPWTLGPLDPWTQGDLAIIHCAKRTFLE